MERPAADLIADVLVHYLLDLGFFTGAGPLGKLEGHAFKIDLKYDVSDISHAIHTGTSLTSRRISFVKQSEQRNGEALPGFSQFVPQYSCLPYSTMTRWPHCRLW
jgi:hypothetical protein